MLLEAYTGEITEDRYYRLLGQIRPRGQVEYSNVHFTLAGRIIERFDRKTWREALHEYVFNAAGMSRTTGSATRLYSDPDCALPLEPRGTRWVPALVRKTDRTMHAAGGLGTTARDVSRWLRINLNGGAIDGHRLLSEQAMKQMHTLQASANGRTPIRDYRQDGFGLGWQVGSYRGRRMVSHGGEFIGAAAFISFLPDEEIGVAVLTNTAGPAGHFAVIVALDVYRQLLRIDGDDPLPQLIEKAKRRREDRAAIAVPDSFGTKELSLAPKKYMGVYESEIWGTLRIEQRDGQLRAAMGDLAIPVKLTSIDRLRVRVGRGAWSGARFELEGGGVKAVFVELPGVGTVRFVQRPN